MEIGLYVRRSPLLACIALLFSIAASAQTVTVSPTSISFSNQVEGTTSAVQKVTLKNGQTSAITISSITTSLSDYAATSNCPASPSTLAAAATCTISISFKPTAVGTRSGTLTVTDTGTSSPQQVTLTGTGLAPTLTSIAVTPAAPSVAAGHTEQFTATGTYNNGTKQTLTSGVTWTSSATSIATVSSSGLATSSTQGSATITATSGTVSGSATLTVTAPVLTSIAVTPATASVAAGLSNQFTATGTYSNGTTSNLTSTATWTSSANGVATVSGGLATSVAKGTATITATSGTIKGSATLTVTAAALTSIAVTPASPSVAAGLKQQFTATGTYTNQTTANLSSSVTWSSSATTVATVSTAGLATSLAQGSTTITATSGAITGSATLTVTPAVLTSIAVTPAAPSVVAGHTEQFTATGTYSNGTKQTLTSTATWASLSTSVATINTSGLATTLIQGSAAITATSGAISGTATLTVTAPVLTSIAVTPAPASVAAGYTEQFTATGTYSNGTQQNLTSSATWTSSSTSVATINASGLATTLIQGTSTITATSGTIHASAALTVTAPTLLSIAVTPAATSVAAGDPQQFAATGTYSNGTTKNLTSTASWTSSAPSIAKVSGGGLATSVTQGSVTISATSGSVVGSAALTVTAPVLVSIGVNPPSATIAKGTSQQFTATGTFSDGSTQNVTSAVTWSSSSPVAGVGTGGLASGEGVGTATITATSGTIAGSATLNVGQAVLVSIAVTPTNGSFALGTTLPLVATGTYSDGSTLVLTTTAVWSTANSGIATVNGQGIASSAGVGNTTVTATVGTISGTTTVTVNPAVLVSITMTPAIPTIPMGTTEQFMATGSFTDGSTQNLTSTVQWSSDTPAVGVMSTTTAGLVSSEGTGTANITATSGTVSGTTQLTVTAAALVSIAVTPAEVSIAKGTSQQFTATGTFTDGTTQNLSGMVTWSSDTPGTGTISNTMPTQGLATGVGTGTANITASSGTMSGTAQLAVTAAALVSIAINPPAASIPLGTTQQFTATGTYTDGTTQDLTQNGQWTSTTATVATISDTPGTMGLASPLTTGTTTIGISSGGVSATGSLVVNPAALVSIAINPPAASIALGTTQQFTATGTYTDRSTQDVTSVVTWGSSTTATAIISNTLGSYGLATSAGQGTTSITATLNTISGTGSLTVNGPSLVSIAITPGNAALPLGESLQFDAVGTYTDGSTQDLTQTAVWASSVATVAAVNSPGYISALLSGTTVISASSGSVTGSATLVVNSPVPVSLVLTPALASILTGAQQQFTATLNYSDGSSVNVTAAVAWNSMNYSVASVGSAGLVAGITSGSTTIQATWGGNVFTANASITVSVPVPKTWYVSPGGNDANNCLSSSAPCFTPAQAESLSAAGDTITLAAGTYRLSPGGSSTAGQIVPKSNQTFIGPPCTPTSAPCQAIISGGVSIGGLATGPDALGNWSVIGQTQQGTVNTSASCDAGWGACIYPEDLFVNGVPLQHVVASSEPALAANQWWFDYTNHIIYFSQNPAGNTVEASVLETAFSPNGANNVTIKNLTVEEFASPVQRGAIDPAFSGYPNTSASLNWTIENSYITLNHGYGVRGAFGMQVLNNMLTNNGNFGVGGGIQAGTAISSSQLLVQGNTVSYNNYAHVSPEFGGGGMKFGNTAYATIRNNAVTNNLGNGIHFDDDSLFPLIDGNTVTGNVDPEVSGGEAGISFEIGFGGATVRNNIVSHNGDTANAGPETQIISATSVGMQAYCNVIETGANSHESAFEVTAGDRGYNTEEPYLGTYMVSSGNYVHHNTVIWDAGSTASAGYFQSDATNQPNFFSVNTPPNYNQYHSSNTGQSVFVYANVGGDNKEENFLAYQSLGADMNSTIDPLNTSGYPTVSITSPYDQSSVSNGFSVAASASDPGGINRLEFFVDWNLAGTVSTTPYNFAVGALSAGPHTIAAMAFNNAGIQNCYAITVND